MRTLSGIIAFLIAFPLAIAGQALYTVTGRVVDENGHELPGANVMLNPGEVVTITDEDGEFILPSRSGGGYRLEISFLGYKQYLQEINLQADIHLNVRLSPALLSLQEVVVACHHDQQRKMEESLGIEVVSEDYLRQNQGGSLVSSLERLPGISAIEIGSGQSKPVIRGLGFNRVVVVENGIKHEGQQWGADHGLEIDQYAVDNLEVIKGPASLIYGSDAIGGVINIQQNNLPAENTWRGAVNLTGKSNNNLLGGSLHLEGRKNRVFARVRATLLDYADYKVPTDSVDIYSYRAALHNNRLRNTAGQERNFHVTLGFIDDHLQSRLFFSTTNSKSGFFANAHGLEPRNVDAEKHDASDRDIHFPYQTVAHFKVISKSEWQKGNLGVKLNLGFQQNFRQEWSEYVSHGYMPPVFPDTLAFDPDLEREFLKNDYSGALLMDLATSERIAISAGINSGYQENSIDGRGFIIPEFTQFTLGAFSILRYQMTDNSIFRTGVRYDYGRIETDAYYDWFPSPVVENGDTTLQYLQRSAELDRNFSSFSWSVGYNYNPGNWIVKLNMGKSFRMPIAKELAANGVNYHRFSYETGNPDLSPEISYQLDAGVEYSGGKFAVGISPFVNYFTNYIFLNPGYEHDRLYGNGNQVYSYTESEVFRYGGEIHAHYKLLQFLQIGVIGEYVYSEQTSGEKEGFTLPFSPPLSAVFNIKYKDEKMGFVRDPYLSLDVRITAPQDNIVPPEEPTDGYQVLNTALGGSVFVRGERISVSMQILNVLNNKYFNHTSYYRLINVPEAGRNFVVNISIPFTGEL